MLVLTLMGDPKGSVCVMYPYARRRLTWGGMVPGPGSAHPHTERCLLIGSCARCAWLGSLSAGPQANPPAGVCYPQWGNRPGRAPGCRCTCCARILQPFPCYPHRPEWLMVVLRRVVSLQYVPVGGPRGHKVGGDDHRGDLWSEWCVWPVFTHVAMINTLRWPRWRLPWHACRHRRCVY